MNDYGPIRVSRRKKGWFWVLSVRPHLEVPAIPNVDPWQLWTIWAPCVEDVARARFGRGVWTRLARELEARASDPGAFRRRALEIRREARARLALGSPLAYAADRGLLARSF